MANFSDLSIGQKVIVHDSQLSVPREGVIRFLNDQSIEDIRTSPTAGKEVGVELLQPHPLGNGLDEKLDDDGKIQWDSEGNAITNVKEKHGWWARAADIETLD